MATQGFKRYSGLWKGPPPGAIGKKDIAVGVKGLAEQMKAPMFVSKGGIGYGVDETWEVVDDGKGWVWLAAEMSPGGLAVELFKSVPFGKRALLVAKSANVDEIRQGELGPYGQAHRHNLGRPTDQAAMSFQRIQPRQNACL